VYISCLQSTFGSGMDELLKVMNEKPVDIQFAIGKRNNNAIESFICINCRNAIMIQYTDVYSLEPAPRNLNPTHCSGSYQSYVSPPHGVVFSPAAP